MAKYCLSETGNHVTWLVTSNLFLANIAVRY